MVFCGGKHLQIISLYTRLIEKDIVAELIKDFIERPFPKLIDRYLEVKIPAKP